MIPSHTDLENRLKVAADAQDVHHPGGVNLFREALGELRRLWAIEHDVDLLLEPMPTYEDWDRSFKRSSDNRLAAGRRLGIAVGAIKEKK
jgi:hypothetical protein